MIGKLTAKYFIYWIFILTICLPVLLLVGEIEGDKGSNITFTFVYYIFFGFLGLVGSFVLAIGSVGVETTSNVLKDVDKYNDKHRKQ